MQQRTKECGKFGDLMVAVLEAEYIKPLMGEVPGKRLRMVFRQETKVVLV